MKTGIFRLYLLSLVIPLAALTLVAGSMQSWFTWRATLRQVEATQRVEVQLAAARIATLSEGAEILLRDFSAMPWGSSFLGLQDRLIEMRRLLKVAPAIREVALLAAAGEEAQVVSRLDAASRRAPDEAMLRLAAAARGGSPARSPVRIEAGGIPVIALAMPEAGSGAITVASLDLRFASDLVRTLSRPGEVVVSLVDASGRILAHPDATHVLSGSFRPEIREPITRAAAAQDGVSWGRAASSLTGRDVYMGVAEVRGLGAWAVVEQETARTLEPVVQSLVQTLLLVLASVLFGTALSVYLARRLSNPIVDLRERARRFGRGEFSPGPPLAGPREVADLDRELGHMAAQLSEYTTGLERKVSEKTAQLELANRHKSEFLANMSHELRTPLNAVIGFSDALREQLFGPLNGKQMEYVKDIHASGQHLLSLINDILDLAKVEAGRMELDNAHFDIAQALENARALIRERAHGRGLHLSFALSADLGTWFGDERKLKQVMLNLLSNAVKFTPRGGGVTVEARREPGALVITVRDTGPGIALKDQAVIFEEFHQLAASGEAKHEGTGLGLALTRRLVELQGGRIDVSSVPGEGSTFTIHLPERAPDA